MTIAISGDTTTRLSTTRVTSVRDSGRRITDPHADLALRTLDHQDRYGNQFRWQLARHSVAEELIVYPAFEKYLGDTGKVQADRDREQHHKVSRLFELVPHDLMLTLQSSRCF